MTAGVFRPKSICSHQRQKTRVFWPTPKILDLRKVQWRNVGIRDSINSGDKIDCWSGSRAFALTEVERPSADSGHWKRGGMPKRNRSGHPFSHFGHLVVLSKLTEKRLKTGDLACDAPFWLHLAEGRRCNYLPHFIIPFPQRTWVTKGPKCRRPGELCGVKATEAALTTRFP